MHGSRAKKKFTNPTCTAVFSVVLSAFSVVHLYHHTACILVTVLNIPVKKLNEI